MPSLFFIALDDLVNSQPKYYFFDRDSPNFRKSNYQNKKSIVNGYFEQYNYFPWNKVSNIIFDGLSFLLISRKFNIIFLFNFYNKST